MRALSWKILLVSWHALDRLDLNAKCEAFSSVFYLYSEREAIILSPAGGMSKFQLCGVLSNLLSLMLIIFLLASTLWEEAKNTVFVVQRLCAFIKWCWHNPSLEIHFLLQESPDCFVAVVSCCPGKMHAAGKEINLVGKRELKMGGLEGSVNICICL